MGTQGSTIRGYHGDLRSQRMRPHRPPRLPLRLGRSPPRRGAHQRRLLLRVGGLPPPVRFRPRDVGQEGRGDRGLTVDGKLVTFSKEADFAKVDWQGKGVEMVMECTGKFLKVKELDAYFAQCGVQRV